MSNQEIIFPNTSTDTVVIPEGNNILPPSVYNISIGKEDDFITFGVQWETLERGIKTLIYSHKKESLLIEVIRNFLRKINFSELNESLASEEITEEQYDKEINEHGDKYAITLKSVTSREDITLIIELVDKIGYDIRDLSASEVSEMFSAKESDLIKTIKSLKF